MEEAVALNGVTINTATTENIGAAERRRNFKTRSLKVSIRSASKCRLLWNEAESSWIKWVTENINYRRCCNFVETEQTALCKCGHSINEHDTDALHPQAGVNQSIRDWNVTEHTRKLPTNAFGKIRFGPDRVAKYIRVDSEARGAEMDRVIELMRGYWKLQTPNLVILVGGGAREFKMEVQMARKFREGIIRAAQSTGAWIFTSGTYSGVMKHTGKAVRDCSLRGIGLSEVVCIGVVPWGIVRGRYRLVNLASTAEYSMTEEKVEFDVNSELLDPHHTHFLLVDNGTKGKYNVEWDFFAELKRRISCLKPDNADYSVQTPLCYLMVEGGHGTLREAYETVKLKIPVVVVKGSGRVSEVFADAYLSSQPCHNKRREESFEVDDRMLTSWAIMLRHLSNDYPKGSLKHCVEMIRKCMTDYRDYVTVFSMNVSDSSCTLDAAIIRALFRARKSLKTNLQLCVSWNRCDLAQQFLFHDSGSEATGREAAFFHDLTHQAILLDRADFVRTFLQCGLSLKKFLNVPRLAYLYNQIPSSCLLRTRLNIIQAENRSCRSSGSRRETAASARKYVSLRHVGLLLSTLFGDRRSHTYCVDWRYRGAIEEQLEKFRQSTSLNPRDHRKASVQSAGVTQTSFVNRGQKADSFDDPAFDLFIYCVLLNRTKMALVFLSQVSDSLGAALAAMVLLRAMAKLTQNMELRKQLRASGAVFETCACEMLTLGYKSHPLETQHLLIRRIPILNRRTCLELARSAFAIQFLCHECVQNFFVLVWFGRINDFDRPSKTRTIVAACFVPPILYALTYGGLETLGIIDNDLETGTYSACLNNPNNTTVTPVLDCSDTTDALAARIRSVTAQPQQLVRTNLQKIIYFYNSPFVMFINTILMHMVFLFVLGYDLLVQYNAPTAADATISLGENYAELFLISYAAMYAVEEVFQAFSFCSRSKRLSLKFYIVDVWNIIEIFGLISFALAMVMGNVAVSDELLRPVRDCGRVAYAISAIAFTLKTLHWLIPHEALGPKVFMVGRMTVELAAFIVVLFIFIAAWGLAEYALLFPRAHAQWTLLRDVLSLSYWQIFENFYLDVIRQKPFDMRSGDEVCTNDPALYGNHTAIRCSDPTGQWVVPILLGVYVVVTNILLINLLIAIFNDVINSKEVTTAHWGFQRIEVILEFHFRFSSLPPPLSVIPYVYRFFRVCSCSKTRTSKKMFSSVGHKRIPLRVKFDSAHEQNLCSLQRSIRHQYFSKLEDDDDAAAVKHLQRRLDSIEKQLQEIQESQKSLLRRKPTRPLSSDSSFVKIRKK